MLYHSTVQARLAKTVDRLAEAVRKGKLSVALNLGRQADPLLTLAEKLDKPATLCQVDVLSADQIMLKHGLDKPAYEKMASVVLHSGVAAGLSSWAHDSPQFDILLSLAADKCPAAHEHDEYCGILGHPLLD